MAVLTLPTKSQPIVYLCLVTQAFVLYAVAGHPHRSPWLALIAFFAGGFITDLISGLFHFSFDYVWPPKTPIMGPISVEFQAHHVEPGLDPSALTSNLTRGAYGALPFALLAWGVNSAAAETPLSFLGAATIMWASLWMLGFHQIHSYTHMGSRVPAEEFNRAVAVISRLPSKRQQELEFIKLFRTVGIPRFVWFLQRCRLFLRPELHWRHHINFESDFSSVNGWSDPVMNWFYGRIARRKKAARAVRAGGPAAAALLPPSEA
jgi:hypothetical protein